MRISLILLTLVSILGCKDTKKNDEPKETRGELMERIEREKERRTPVNPILRENGGADGIRTRDPRRDRPVF